MKRISTVFLALCLALLAHTGNSQRANNTRSIVLLTTAKTHGPGEHEHMKNARLIKAMLEHSNLTGIKVDIYNVWPDDTTVLDKADLIMTLSDGRDGLDERMPQVPFMTTARMKTMERQMKRGCGLVTYHFSTFAPDAYGKQVEEWNGGYFDWQGDDGQRNWYSALTTVTADVQLPSPAHPISTGVKPFRIEEEFYYNLRFRDNDERLKPLADVPSLHGRAGTGNTVAWAVERADGGRGFGTSMGHFYRNWSNDNFRTLMLNGIAWAAGIEIPRGGVKAKFYSVPEVTQFLFHKKLKALILTGNNHPAHTWRETTALIKKILEDDSPFQVDVSTTIHDLYQYDLSDYDVLVMNYCNWNDPGQLHDSAKARTVRYLKDGGGMLIVHFANGAFHYSLPNAAASDWPEYRKICRRVWDHQSNSSHEAYGNFTVKVTGEKHIVTKGMKDFETTDELYYNQKGDEPIVPLLTAFSKTTGKEEPLAFAYDYGKGHIFQTLLGHNEASFESAGFRRLLIRSAEWAAGVLK